MPPPSFLPPREIYPQTDGSWKTHDACYIKPTTPRIGLAMALASLLEIDYCDTFQPKFLITVHQNPQNYFIELKLLPSLYTSFISFVIEDGTFRQYERWCLVYIFE